MSSSEKLNTLTNSCSDPRQDKPNLWRVAAKIAKCEKPDKVLEALKSVLSEMGRSGPA